MNDRFDKEYEGKRFSRNARMQDEIGRLLAAKAEIDSLKHGIAESDKNINLVKDRIVASLLEKHTPDTHYKDVGKFREKSGDLFYRLLSEKDLALQMLSGLVTSHRWAAIWACAFRWPITEQIASKFVAMAKTDSDIDVRLMAICAIGHSFRDTRIEMACKTLSVLYHSELEPTEIRAQAFRELEHILKFQK